MASFAGHKDWVREGDMPPPAEGVTLGILAQQLSIISIDFSLVLHES